MGGDSTKPPETPSSGEEGVIVQGDVAKMTNAVFAREGDWVGKQKGQPPETSPEQRLEGRGFLEGMLVTWPRARSLSSLSSKEWPLMSHQSHEVLCIKQHSVIISTWEMLLPLPLPEIPNVHCVKGSQGSCREETWCCAWCVLIRPGWAPLCVFGSVSRCIYEEPLWNLMERKSHGTHLLIWGTAVSCRQGLLDTTVNSSLISFTGNQRDGGSCIKKLPSWGKTQGLWHVMKIPPGCLSYPTWGCQRFPAAEKLPCPHCRLPHALQISRSIMIRKGALFPFGGIAACSDILLSTTHPRST